MRAAFLMLLLMVGIACARTQDHPSAKAGTWRSATEKELRNLLPARAPVEKERIEIEMRTASGITNGNGSFVAGVVLITAGYSAEGKYSHFFVTQVPLEVGTVSLAPGDYVFGYRRSNDALEVTFYTAASGKEIGKVEAKLENRKGKIQSFRITPSGDKGVIELGRFVMPYRVTARAQH